MEDNKKKNTNEHMNNKKSDRTEFADEINMEATNKKNNNNK